MLFMPSGIAGLFATVSRLRERFGLVRLASLLLMSVAAALLVAVGAVFAVEMLQRIFSQDYRAMSTLPAGNPWPPIRFLARDWAPNALATWGIPLGLIAVGGLLGRFARTRLEALAQRDVPASASSATSAKAAERTGGPA